MNVALWDRQRRPHACDSYSNITMYGNTEVTPVLRGSFIFYQWLHFGYQGNFTKCMMKFEDVTNFVVIVISFIYFKPASTFACRHL